MEKRANSFYPPGPSSYNCVHGSAQICLSLVVLSRSFGQSGASVIEPVTSQRRPSGAQPDPIVPASPAELDGEWIHGSTSTPRTPPWVCVGYCGSGSESSEGHHTRDSESRGARVLPENSGCGAAQPEEQRPTRCVVRYLSPCARRYAGYGRSGSAISASTHWHWHWRTGRTGALAVFNMQPGPSRYPH